MTIIFAARAAMTLLKVGPSLLRAKPIIFASRLSPSGQVLGGYVQGKVASKGITIGLNAAGISTVIANAVIGVTLEPITQGRIRDVNTAGMAVVEGFQDLRFGRPTLQGVGDIGGVLVNPLVAPVVLRKLAKDAGIPAWVLFII